MALAFNPKKSAHGFPLDEDISDILKKLRRSSLPLNAFEQGAKKSKSVEDDYQIYLKNELVIVIHILDCLDRIRSDTRGKRASATVLSALNMGDLEKSLTVPVKSTEGWATQMGRQLGLLVGVRDWVPRSQLTFTLQLVRRNAESILKLRTGKVRTEKLRSEKTGEESSGDQNQGQDSDGEASASVMDYDAESYNIFNEPNGGVDHSNSNSNSIPDDDDRRTISDVDNRLIAAHEHITQHKFNCASLAILNSMAERKRFKNDSEWVCALYLIVC